MLATFIIILAAFLGFFLLSLGVFHTDRPPAQGQGAALLHGPPSHETPFRAARQASTLPVFPIDLNSATVEELKLLPGVGDKTAERIVEKRAELGGFGSVDDLLGVKRFGRSRLEKIRGLVTLGAKEKKKQVPSG
jgi:competence ComEA-like helix-hairpin-helix protein